MGSYPFYDERFDVKGGLKPHAFNEPRYKGASVLISNVNFGCGSSREHAPQALLRWGITAVVAASLAESVAENGAMLVIPSVVAEREEAAGVEKLPDDHPEAEVNGG